MRIVRRISLVKKELALVLVSDCCAVRTRSARSRTITRGVVAELDSARDGMEIVCLVSELFLFLDFKDHLIKLFIFIFQNAKATSAAKALSASSRITARLANVHRVNMEIPSRAVPVSPISVRAINRALPRRSASAVGVNIVAMVLSVESERIVTRIPESVSANRRSSAIQICFVCRQRSILNVIQSVETTLTASMDLDRINACAMQELLAIRMKDVERRRRRNANRTRVELALNAEKDSIKSIASVHLDSMEIRTSSASILTSVRVSLAVKELFVLIHRAVTIAAANRDTMETRSRCAPRHNSTTAMTHRDALATLR